MQVLLVTGGENDNDGSLKSTEVLEAGGSWRQTGSLPSARFGLRAAVLDNNIFVFGDNIFRYVISVLIIELLIVSKRYTFTGGYDYGPYLKDILQYNTANHTWENVGEMKEARYSHAVGVLGDVSQICP